MKPRKQTILIMLLGLLLVAFAVSMAQTPAQGDQKKPAESCCSMESCCCNNGSCPMKKEGETTSADAAEAKHDCCCSGDSCDMKAKAEMKSHADDQSCCACCGDSCDMSKHDATMKHDTNMKHDMKGHKDCCNMKQKAKNKKAA